MNTYELAHKAAVDQLMQNYYLLVAKRVDGSIFAPVKCKVLTALP